MIRAAILAVLLLCLADCGGPQKPSACTPAVLAEIEGRYTASVIAECTTTTAGGEIVNPWGTIDECPAMGSLLAKRRAEETAASCR